MCPVPSVRAVGLWLCRVVMALPAGSQEDCGGSVASFLRSAASTSGLPRDLDHVTIPDVSGRGRLGVTAWLT